MDSSVFQNRSSVDRNAIVTLLLLQSERGLLFCSSAFIGMLVAQIQYDLFSQYIHFTLLLNISRLIKEKDTTNEIT
jgi:hypothetical protein